MSPRSPNPQGPRVATKSEHAVSRAENEKRQAIIDACRWMNALGINHGTSGNISIRHEDGMLITSTSVPYDAMTPEQIAFRCAPCAAYGTPELSEYAVTALEGRMACLLEHHGMIAVGSSLEKAFGSPSKSRHSRASTTAVWRSANRPCCRATRSNAFAGRGPAMSARMFELDR